VGDIQYYYSRDGNEVNGPFTINILRQLMEDRVINSGCYFCREGDAEWQLLDPAVLAAEPDPEPPADVAPRSAASERLDSLWSAWVEIMESPSILIFLRIICAIVPLILAFILTSHYARSLPETEHMENNMGPLAGCFTGVVVGVSLVVYLIGLPFPHAYRLWIRSSAMLLLAVPVATGLIR
jgi:hypothetical protein